MSSEHPSDAPSPAEPADAAEPDLSLASVIHLRGIALLEGLNRHAPGLEEHADGTASYAFATAVEMGFDRAHAEAIREAAKLHDVGKIYVPAEVLAKPVEELSTAEREQLGSRHEAGYRLALGAGIPEEVCEWIRRSGERFDGQGGGGVGGSSIPLASRIANVACTCDSLLSRAGLAAAGPRERRREAIESLRSAAGAELDPDAVAALTAVLERAG